MDHHDLCAILEGTFSFDWQVRAQAEERLKELQPRPEYCLTIYQVCSVGIILFMALCRHANCYSIDAVLCVPNFCTTNPLAL